MFRPCIDLHEGKVKQIVGGSLREGAAGPPLTNFETDRPASWFAGLYRADGLRGGHVIQLGAGNDAAARDALAAWPGGLQLGGGVTLENAAAWLDVGASHVIVTSWVFREGSLDEDRLRALCAAIGRRRLVLDLSCRWRGDNYYVTTNRWQTFTDLAVNARTLERLAGWCDEFLIHAVDVEGLRQGVDERLIARLAEGSPIPMTYAGGARSIDDLDRVERTGRGRVDVTVGSALDIFGGALSYREVVNWSRQASARRIETA